MSKTSEGLSPWGMASAKTAVIAPVRPFEAIIAVPGSKSYTNRALILAAVAEGASVLKSPLFSDDSYWCTQALEQLDVTIDPDKEAGIIGVTGLGPDPLKSVPGENVFIGSAGTIARFLPGMIAAKGEGEVRLTATDQLSRRPVAELVDALRQLGAEIEFETEGKSFPMIIQGGTLKGGEVTITGAKSSQFISGLLMAAPLAAEPVTIIIPDEIVQEDYVRITLELMEQFGVTVKVSNDFKRFDVTPQSYKACEIELEADASTATCFLALAAATKSRITVTNLNDNTHQPDIGFLDHLKTLGCDVIIEGTSITVIGPEKLKSDLTYDFNPCSDSTPAMAGIAPFALGKTEIRGIKHIRTHESDRIHVICESLIKAGVKVDEHEDGLTVYPTDGAPRSVQIDPHDDHRMAMAFAVMGAAGEGIEISDPACVSKTCPTFFELLRSIGVDCELQE